MLAGRTFISTTQTRPRVVSDNHFLAVGCELSQYTVGTSLFFCDEAPDLTGQRLSCSASICCPSQWSQVCMCCIYMSLVVVIRTTNAPALALGPKPSCWQTLIPHCDKDAAVFFHCLLALFPVNATKPGPLVPGGAALSAFWPLNVNNQSDNRLCKLNWFLRASGSQICDVSYYCQSRFHSELIAASIIINNLNLRRRPPSCLAPSLPPTTNRDPWGRDNEEKSMLFVPGPHLPVSFIFLSEENRHVFSFLLSVSNTKIALKLFKTLAFTVKNDPCLICSLITRAPF